MRWWAVAVTGWASSGCIPFVIPPGQASAGAATTGSASKKGPEDDAEGNYSMRAAVHPLGLLDEQHRRTFDFGAGYAVERVARREGQLFAQGPYVEVAAYPWRTRTGNWIARGGVRTSVDTLISDEGWGEAGYGGSVALAFELASFAKGAFVEGGGGDGVAGVAFGEGGIGAFAGVSHRRFADDAYWLGSAGVSLRIPAAAGVFCCLRPR